MGPAQGKLETVNAVAVHRGGHRATIADTGTTDWRPMYAPVTLGALAGRIFEPVRYSPMQPWHERHGARPAGGGAVDPTRPLRGPRRRGPRGPRRRRDHRRDPDREARPARPDVPALLDLLYVNRWSKLGVGRVRYGVMCAEDGVVLDDGVTGRLAEDRYLMSTTSSRRGDGLGVGGELAADRAPRMAGPCHPGDHRATPASTVAGPRSRELARRLAEGVDLAREAFGYMHVRTGTWPASTDCVLWRIGFTGELVLRAPRPGRLRAARVGGADRRRARISAWRPSASRRSGSCGWRRATSSSVRTPTA